MTKLKMLPVVVAAVAVAAAAPSAPAGSTKIVKFTASYAGTATTKVTGDQVDIAARATGLATLVGKSTLSGKGVGTKSGDANCVPFSGPGTIVTSTKPKLVLKFVVQPSSTGCAGEDQNQVTVSGAGKFMGGTGKLKKGRATYLFTKARGTFTFNGYYDRGTGAFNVKFSGTLRI